MGRHAGRVEGKGETREVNREERIPGEERGERINEGGLGVMYEGWRDGEMEHR